MTLPGISEADADRMSPSRLDAAKKSAEKEG